MSQEPTFHTDSEQLEHRKIKYLNIFFFQMIKDDVR